MKAIFNIAKNIRNSRSVSALSALRKLQSLGLVVCALLFGYVQVWGVNWYKVDNLSDITSGDSVLVVLQDGATLTVGKAFKVGAGTSSNSVDVTITSNSYISDPGTNIRWAMTKSGDNYVFKSSTNKYIGSSSSTNNNVTGNEGSTYSWYITKLSNGYFKLQLTNSSGRYISWKSAEFGKYANSNFKNQITLSTAIDQFHGAISFYKKASGYAVTYNNGGHGTAPSSTTASAVTLTAITGVTGYTCTGWKANVAVTVGGVNKPAGTLLANGTNVTLSQATTFTAQWETAKYTVSFGVSPAGYGTVSQASVTNVPHGTVPSSSTNTVTVNGTTVTATPHAQDADYNYAFSSWSGIPESVTSAVTITANFTRTARPLTNYRTSCCTDPELSFLDENEDPTTTYTIVREDLASASTAVEIDCDFGSLNTSSEFTWYSTSRAAKTFPETGATSRTTPSSQLSYMTIDMSNKTITASQTGIYTITIKQAGATISETVYCDAEAEVVVTVKTVDKFIDAVNGNFSGEAQRLEDVGGGILLPTEATFSINDACHLTTRRLLGWIKASDLNSYRTSGNTGYIDTWKTGDPATNKVIAPGTRVEATGVTWYAVWGEEVTP